MAQVVYVFQMPWGTLDTVEVIANVVSAIGKLKKKDPATGIVAGKWKQKEGLGYLFEKKIVFYVEQNVTTCKVRAVINGVEQTAATIATENCNKTINTKVEMADYIWDVFVNKLLEMYPYDYGIYPLVKREPLKVLCVLDKSNGKEMVYTSRTTGGTSAAGFLLGGMMFGEAGAIVGGLSGTSRTITNGGEQYSNKIMLTVIFSNGRMQEGKLKKKSPLYHEIMINFQSM